jgi:hypothetical protein
MLDVELQMIDFRLPITSFRIHTIENSCPVFHFVATHRDWVSTKVIFVTTNSGIITMAYSMHILPAPRSTGNSRADVTL